MNHFRKLLICSFLAGILAVSVFMVSWTPFGQPSDSAEKNYAEYCASCHGDKLESFVDRKWIYGNSWNEVLTAIKYGYPDDGMSAYDTTFTEKELQELTDFVLTGIEEFTLKDFEEKPDFSGVVKTELLDLRLDTVVTGLDVPWGLGFLPEGQMLISDRGGRDDNHEQKGFCKDFGCSRGGGRFSLTGRGCVRA